MVRTSLKGKGKKMPNYKAPDNSLHFLDDDSFAYLLPVGSVAITDEEAEALRPKPPLPSAEEIKQTMIDAIQKHLDETAQTHGYDGILSLASYTVSAHPQFATEGRAGADWRDAVWGYGYQVLADVQAGTRTVPTVDALIVELPAMAWPV
jgi:hypothetical protein